MDCQLSFECLNSDLQSTKMKFLILVVLVSIVVSEARYDKQTAKPPPIKPYNPLPAHESSSPMPYKFSYEVKGDDYTSFGDTRVGDRQGKVSGYYHVQLADGRHQHVTYKDEGKGFIADVKYEGEAKYSESKPVEYKKLADDFGTSYKSADYGLQNVEPSYKELSYENSVKENQLNEWENEKSRKSSDEKSSEQFFTEPVYNFPTALFYQEISSTTSSYKEYEYTPSSEKAVDTTQVPHTTKTYDVPPPSSTSFWKPISVTSNYKPVYTTADYKTTSIFTTPASIVPSTTPDYHKPVNYTEANKKTTANKAYKKPVTTPVYKTSVATTPAYKTPSPSKTPKAPKAPKKPKASYPVTTPAYKKPIYFDPVYKTPVVTTSGPKHYPTTTYAYKTHPYTPKAYKAASYQILPQKPFTVYKPYAKKVPVITRVAPYTAPVYKTPIYIAPGYNNVPPNKVVTYKHGK
ncbi:hypothetical protein OUZ56_026765 [Daphnia magna]|uniref:Cuticle protein n=1 Tax=Daphnia magna TaxID=35525 RepID=A0ABQ9ZMQ7_9CRUS|nr:hypothetical protein OUZ56_026765 [Daphnia magna]